MEGCHGRESGETPRTPMRPSRSLVWLIVVAALRVAAGAIQPEVAELSFGPDVEKEGALAAAEVPAWVAKIEQQGGRFLDDPRCWQAVGTAAAGVGRVSIGIDRKRMNEDLVATILFDAGETADIAVQLFDAQGRVVEVDLFGNLVEVGKEATTDTFIIPLRKYPTAEKIVLRRVSGDVKVYGVVLYPAVTEGTPNPEALAKLARVLGDPLSPENPLSKGIQQVARSGNVTLTPVLRTSLTTAPDAAAAAPAVVEKYPGAVAPDAGAVVPPVPGDGLVGYWNFDRANAADASGRGHDGRLRGGARFVSGVRGEALLLRKNPSSARAVSWDSVTLPATPDLDLKETLTVSAWVKYSSIAPRWGSQIAWFGDSQFGRDPWDLHLYPDGTLEFRTDRSVTGKPVFTVHEDEIKLSPSGEPMPNQHVSVQSPKTLAPETWYFVAGTLERFSPKVSALKLYVNGEIVARARTGETVNYPTEQMWMSIGGVDEGTWQNFDGAIDEVRVYNRALTPAEIKALYGQPWQ